MKKSSNEAYNEADTLQDLLRAEREGEELGRSEDIVDLGLEESAETATSMVNRDAERLIEARANLLKDSQSQIDRIDKKQIPEDAHLAVEALKQNQAELSKSKSRIKRLFGL